MRKVCLLAFFICCLNFSLLATGYTPLPANCADTLNNYNEKADLPLLGKLWGFLKYYHPGITNTKIDWDKQLVDFLPVYMNNTGKASRDSILLRWMNDLG